MATYEVQNQRIPLRATTRSRAGITLLEFLGCIVSVVGGLWLGVLYLGVKPSHLAHRVLDEAQLLDKVPPEWRPEGPNENSVTREQVVTMLRKELGTLRNEIVALRTAAAVVGDPKLLSEAETMAKDRTCAYWQRLSEIAMNESVLQADAERAFDEMNAAKVFAIKARISRFAANSVTATPSESVDPVVVQFGEQLADWYNTAGELYERAVNIWESPTTTQARIQLNKEWRGAELHHRNKARLLYERAAKLRGTLSRQYAAEFAEFATSAQMTPSEPPPSEEPDETTDVTD